MCPGSWEGEGLVGSEWFLREQEGMDVRAGLRRDTACIVTGKSVDSLWLWELMIIICIAVRS